MLWLSAVVVLEFELHNNNNRHQYFQHTKEKKKKNVEDSCYFNHTAAIDSVVSLSTGDG